MSAQPSASEVGLNTDDAELPNDKRIKSRAKHQRGVCATGLSGPPQQKSGRGEIASLQISRAAVDERGDLLGVDTQNRTASLHWRGLRT